MNYSYKIAGRHHNKIEQTIYDGHVVAKNSGEAIKLALKDTFGDPDLDDPAVSLADWFGSHDEIYEEFREIKKNTDVFTLHMQDGEGTSFVIEVTKV